MLLFAAAADDAAADAAEERELEKGSGAFYQPVVTKKPPKKKKKEEEDAPATESWEDLLSSDDDQGEDETAPADDWEAAALPEDEVLEGPSALEVARYETGGDDLKAWWLERKASPAHVARRGILPLTNRGAAGSARDRPTGNDERASARVLERAEVNGECRLRYTDSAAAATRIFRGDESRRQPRAYESDRRAFAGTRRCATSARSCRRRARATASSPSRATRRARRTATASSSAARRARARRRSCPISY